MVTRKTNKQTIFALIFVLIALHPIYELDYLFASFFDGIGIPRITTIIDLIVFPLLVILIFWLYEDNKKKVLKYVLVYGIVFAIYFVFHSLVGFDLEKNAHMGYTAYYSIVDEIVYYIIMMLPLVYIYVLNKTEINEGILEKLTSVMSLIASLPIVISNFLGFGLNTYGVEVSGNFFDWFSMPFNATTNHPRSYATKFFFEEGNTIGILLLMLLPFAYYFLYKEKNNTKKMLYLLIILSDSLAMLMLGTRVSTYGTVIVPILMTVIHIFTVIIKTEKLDKLLIILCVVLMIINARIIPYTPAYQNQQYDATDYSILKLDDTIRDSYRKQYAYAEGFEPFSKEWIDYYCYMFLNYKFLIGVTPSVYYMFYYDYRVDPKFWVDVIFDYELEERVNARQIENIFTKYKWNEFMTPSQHLTGTTYGLFMRGGINIEQDFIQQFYSYGYLGFPLVMGPWVVMAIYLIYKMMIGFKQKKWNMFNIMLFAVIGLGVVGGITSGHVFDELSTSMIISLCFIYLFQNLRRNYEA